MTPYDKSAFDTAFNSLAKAGMIHDADRITKEIYFETLGDLPIWAVVQAALSLRREGAAFFTSAVWHGRAVAVVRDHQRAQDATLSTQVRPDIVCPACNDTGWKGDPAVAVAVCPCRDSNPNYQAIAARARLIAARVEPADPPKQDAATMYDAIRTRDFKRLGSGDDGSA